MRVIKRVAMWAAPAIACSVPLTSAVAIPVPPTSSTVSDVLRFTDHTGVVNLFTCNEGPNGCEGETTTIKATSGAVEFTEPGSTAISDYVFVCNGSVEFVSDNEAGSISLPGCASDLRFANWGAETGDYVNISDDFAGLCLNPVGESTCTRAEGAILSFASDVSDPQGVPEPATWAVMLGGLLSLFGFGMMRRHADA